MSQDSGSPHYHRSLRLMDGALLVIGSMIGSGIFIVSADITRSVGSAGWMIVVWVLTGLLTVAAATSYGELSGMYPKAGGQYVYLREAYGPLWGFLYGWAFFAVIQTGTIAAVGVAFAKFAGYLAPGLGEDNVLLRLGSFQITAAQLTGIGIILLLTVINTGGIKSGKIIGAIFTSAKIVAMAALIIAGFVLVKDGGAIWKANWDAPWLARSIQTKAGTIHHEILNGGPLVVAICVAMVGSIFSSDAWNGVTFIAGEIKRPERNIGLSLLIGTVVVTLLYICMNLMYLNVLSMHDIAFAKQDRVALAASLSLFGNIGTTFIAVLVMISTFGCNNGLILSGARVYSTMANDGLFFPAAAKINKRGVPAVALWMQAVWASVLCLSGKYGDLLDYIVIVALFFYVMTIGGIFVLRRRAPEMERPYKAFGYPVVPVLYMLVASFIAIVLLKYKPATTWPGVVIVLLGWPIYKLLEARLKRIRAAGGGTPTD
jgi:APA family basic amino acid/polyamine antiporter